MTNPYDILRTQVNTLGLKKPDAYNPYAAWPKVYNGASAAPNRGAIADKAGYMKRDARVKATRNALLRKLKQNQIQSAGGRY